jgi:transcription-repair coupling factor (superfamily II helicase)
MSSHPSLASKDVHFKDIRLIMIDEEQSLYSTRKT